MKPNQTKKSGFIAVAALLLLTIVLSLCLLSCSGKQVPVYQGMTVSKEVNAQMKAATSPSRYLTLYDTPLARIRTACP